MVERNINPGQEVHPDAASAGTPPLFVISDPRSLVVLPSLYVSWFSRSQSKGSAA